jgi:anti-sigma B factor antagonist
MDITTTAYKHCEVLTVTGRVDSSTAPQLSEALNVITNAAHYQIVIDMAGVDYMSSAGFRALLAAQRNCKHHNLGEVVLANVPTNINAALELAGFTTLFKIFKDLTSAVGNF